MPEAAAKKLSTKTFSGRKPDAPPAATLQPARSSSGPDVHEIDRAHAVFIRLEVENRQLRAEHALLLKFAQLAALQAKALSSVLAELPGGSDVAERASISTTALYTLTDREQAWIRENVVAPAEALAQTLLQSSADAASAMSSAS